MFRTLSSGDAAALAAIHSDALADDFLPSLGLPFLETLYRALLAQPQVVAFGFEENGDLDGFVLGCERTDRLFRSALATHAAPMALHVAAAVCRRPVLALRVLETFVYPSKEALPSVPAELVVFAIKSSTRGLGNGRQLVSMLNAAFAGREIKAYKIGVNQSNDRANRFYQGLGCVRVASFRMYGRGWNLYRYDL
jgi:ribosomal protein S18 acetylase RimI-like enzyme